MFQFTCLMQHLDMQAIQNKLPDKTGEKNVVSDLAISAQKYPKIVTQQEIFVNFYGIFCGLSHFYVH